MKIENRLSYLTPGAAAYRGAAEEAVQFTLQHQLLNAATWEQFVNVFRKDSDNVNNGWRCEYWGKMMRGAVLTYMYNKDAALYRVLEKTVTDLLETQRPDGRISTYSAKKQLRGWDIWGRKYVLTGMLHFCRICESEALKTRIITAMQRHADALIACVGPGEGQVDITLTSNFWGGVNSCSVLEPILDLYTFTGEARYMAFAEYILSTGGCCDGNLIEAALENRLKPYEYPEVKAYETMSFFEGVLAYYTLTGEKKYLTAVTNFIEAVAETDITAIGCSGCTHELFDHSAVKQTEPSDGIMQETCVTVTWMRMMARLHLLTGEKKYMDRLEHSAWNALYGALNKQHLPQYDMFNHVWLKALPFDSYSPLFNNTRGIGIGGLNHFEEGGYYGCCACIASAGIALVPLTAVLQEKDRILVNHCLSGRVTARSAEGTPFTFSLESAYPHAFAVTCTVETAGTATLAFRLPAFLENVRVCINGTAAEASPEEGYLCLRRSWQAGNLLTLEADMPLRSQTLNGKTAFFYGPLTLARDARKEDGAVDLAETVCLTQPVTFAVAAPEADEQLRLTIPRTDGKPPLLLTDYASCGKYWRDEKNRMTVWMNIR